MTLAEGWSAIFSADWRRNQPPIVGGIPRVTPSKPNSASVGLFFVKLVALSQPLTPVRAPGSRRLACRQRLSRSSKQLSLPPTAPSIRLNLHPPRARSLPHQHPRIVVRHLVHPLRDRIHAKPFFREGARAGASSSGGVVGEPLRHLAHPLLLDADSDRAVRLGGEPPPTRPEGLHVMSEPIRRSGRQFV